MRQIVVIALIVLLVVGVLAFLFIKLTAPANNSSFNPPANTVFPYNVVVSGAINAHGNGITPISVIFSNDSGVSYYGKVNGGKYSVAVRNPNLYSIRVLWTGSYPWQSGGTDSGQLRVNQQFGMSDSVLYNLNITEPDAVIAIKGNVTTHFATVPRNITFKYYNRAFTGSITANTSNTIRGNYSIALPNWTNYTVILSYKGLYNTSGSCVAGHFDEQINSWVSNNIKYDYSC